MTREQILHSEFCEHFKKVRTQFGSQPKLSAESEIDTADISNYERANKKPGLDRLLIMGDTMDCDLRFVPRVKK